MKHLLCLLFGHRYWIIQTFGPAERKLGCRRCDGVWGMNDRTKSLVPWDGELEELYDEPDGPVEYMAAKELSERISAYDRAIQRTSQAVLRVESEWNVQGQKYTNDLRRVRADVSELVRRVSVLEEQGKEKGKGDPE